MPLAGASIGYPSLSIGYLESQLGYPAFCLGSCCVGLDISIRIKRQPCRSDLARTRREFRVPGHPAVHSNERQVFGVKFGGDRRVR